jgi:hypothetical protein
MIVKEPENIPAPPTPARARPTINVVLFLDTAVFDYYLVRSNSLDGIETYHKLSFQFRK